ncbi:hypothetical protein PHSC3_000495 [Chlamydiales bacterium STE3]|nr:hypothetical protein PHSC3_000495 [Chlamydiales bacterium STE3]
MKKKKRKKQTLEQSLIMFFIALLASCFVWMGGLETASAMPNGKEPAILYSNLTGDYLQKTLKKAIGNAKESIVLLIYSLSDPEIIQALRKKSEEGLEVRVIYDAKASARVDRKLGPKVYAVARAAVGHMHQKMMVIDSEEVWFGSANMTTDSLCEQANLISAVRCRNLAANILKKAQFMCEDFYEEPVPHHSFTIGGQDCELWFLPDNKDASVRIKNLIREAKKTIRVAMFTFTRFDFAKELISAKQRGVNIEVFLDHQSSKGASKKIADLLQSSGIPVYTNPGSSLLHYKFLYIDQDVLVNGSANWTKAAFQQNDDFFIILHQLNEMQTKKMDELIAHLKDRMATLKIALFGKGKMGMLVAEAALEKGHEIANLENADLAIDFSHPQAVLRNVEKAASSGTSIVVGTTGWENDYEKIQDLVTRYQIGFLYSPNFSIGVHLYLKTLNAAAALIANHDSYDVGGYEMHHQEKADSPSGTAKAITKTLLNHFKNKKAALFETSHGKIAHDLLHFPSLRLGHHPGMHSVIFDSPYDSITVTHEAKNRKGFATGAIQSAEWLNGKKGFFTLEDIL